MAKITFTLPITGGEGSGVTNLSYTASPTDGTVNSDTGTDASIPLADATNAGLLSPAEKIKLNNTSGINNGDQTSIAGITGTKTQFNTAVTDGDFLFVGDVIAYTDEQAQDAVGNILVGSPTIDFTYDDSTPNITATVKTNSITATELSNSINISKFINDSDYATINYVDNHSNRTDNPHNVTKSQIGLGNADNTSDLNKPISITTQTALDLKENKSEKNQINGYAGLDGSGKIFSNQLPALAITDTFVVNSQATMLNLTTAEIGDIAVRTDLNKTFILKGLNYSILTDWQELITPTDSVSSVFGRSGAVIANVGDYTTALVTETTNKNYQTDLQKLYNDATSSIQTQLNNRELLGINSIAEVYVETNGNDFTAVLGNKRKAFLTIDAALDALPLTGGVVRIGIGTFNSPNRLKIKDNTKFVGSGKPYPNMTISYASQGVKPTISSPTKLVGGTILQGVFSITGKNYIEVYNLGIDVGKEWIDANGGVPKNGLSHAANLIGNEVDNNLVPPSKGLVIENIASLNYDANSLVHAVVLENIIDAKIDKISTYYGTHGVVIKGRGVNLSNVIAYGHSSNGVVIKADSYAYCSDINVSNVYISSIGSYDGGGFRLVSSTGGILKRVNVSNLNIEHTIFGVKDDNNGVDGANISNVTIFDVQQNGVYFSEFSKDVVINNLSVDSAGSNGIQLVSFSLDAIKTLTNCTIRNSGANEGYFYAVGGLINLLNIDVTGEIAIDGGATSNVRGFNVRSSGIFTGALVYDATLNNEYISTINSNGKINKSLVKVSSTGLVEFPVTPTAPTAAPGTNNLTIANTNFVNNLVSSGSYTPTISGSTNCVTPGALLSTYTRIGNIITLRLLVLATNFTAANTFTTMTVNLPINRTLNDVKDIGCGSGANASGDYWVAIAQTSANNNTMVVSFKTPSINTGNISLFVQYDITK